MLRIRKCFDVWFNPKRFTGTPHIGPARVEVRCHSRKEAVRAARREFKVKRWSLFLVRFIAYKPTTEERVNPKIVAALKTYYQRIEDRRKLFNFKTTGEVRPMEYWIR